VRVFPSFFLNIKSSRVRDKFQARSDPQNTEVKEIERTKKPFTNPLVQVVLLSINFFFLGILIDLFRGGAAPHARAFPLLVIGTRCSFVFSFKALF